MAPTWTVRKNIIALSAFEYSHGSIFLRKKTHLKIISQVQGVPELRHACANEVPPLSVLQVWTIRENPLFWSGGYPLLLRWKKTSDFIRKSIGFVMRKSLNQSFVRSLLCGEHSSMGKLCRTLRVWFVRFAKNAFASTWERVICWIFRKCIYILDHHCFFLGRCVGRFGSFKSFFCNFIHFYDFMQYQLCFSSIQIVCVMNHHLIKLILSYIPISYCAS